MAAKPTGGKVALVTGSSSGIAAATAARLLAGGGRGQRFRDSNSRDICRRLGALEPSWPGQL